MKFPWSTSPRGRRRRSASPSRASTPQPSKKNKRNKKNTSTQRRKALLLPSQTRSSARVGPSRWKVLRNHWLRFFERFRGLRDFILLVRAQTMATLIFLAMALFVGVAIFSPIFKIKEITYNRDNPGLDLSKIQAELKEFQGQNMLFLSTKTLENKLKNAFPELVDVQTTEIWPDALAVTVTLAEPAFSLRNVTTKQATLISDQGITLSQQTNENLPVIEIHQFSEKIPLQEPFLTPTELSTITYTQSQLTDSFGVEIVAVQYLWAAKELHLVLANGTVIWLDLEQDPETQLAKLLYGKSQLDLLGTTYDHVDLRIPERLIYR